MQEKLLTSIQRTKVEKSEIKLIGITTRTNNKNLFDADQSKNNVAAIVMKYFHEGLAEKIQHRIKAGTTYCAYTEYESNHTGDYTYFIGEEVDSFDNIPEDFVSLIIPAQKYVKFTNGPGPMPAVCVDIWKEIWKDEELEASRVYISDFEIYDERARDRANLILDLYISVK
jgi:predicted transcriptional regulator YdeE